MPRRREKPISHTASVAIVRTGWASPTGVHYSLWAWWGRQSCRLAGLMAGLSLPRKPACRQDCRLHKSAHDGELVQVLDLRPDGSIDPLNLGIRRLDHVILVGRVRAVAVAKPEVSGW